MHELFIQQVARTPDKIAVTDARGSMSYAQLYVACQALADRLVEQGVGVETLVAVRMPKGNAQVIATMAILMAGGAYLPLEVSWPQARCKRIFDKSGCTLMLACDTAHAIDDERVSCLLVDADADSLAPVDSAEAVARAQAFKSRQTAKDLAYVIFTSGSTGEPKGVEMEHFATVNTLLEINRVYEVCEQDAILVVSALSFDLSVYDIFGVLGVGGHVIMPEHDKATDPAHWLALVEQHQITLWDTVPSSAGLLAEQLELQGRQCSAPLRHVMMSGDWIPPALPNRLWQAFPGVQVHSMGGATEGAIWSIHYPVTGRPRPAQEHSLRQAAVRPAVFHSQQCRGLCASGQHR